MKLRFHHEEADKGFLILEAKPQVRGLLGQNSGSYKLTRFTMPYMYFFIKYTTHKHNGKIRYTYPGLSRQGLRIFCSKSPLKNLKSEVRNFYTDIGATVCTNHSYDNKSFDSLDTLANVVVGIWFGHKQYLGWLANHFKDYSSDYSKIPIEKVLAHDWPNPRELSYIFKAYLDTVGSNPKLVNKEWPLKKAKKDATAIQKRKK